MKPLRRSLWLILPALLALSPAAEAEVLRIPRAITGRSVARSIRRGLNLLRPQAAAATAAARPATAAPSAEEQARQAASEFDNLARLGPESRDLSVEFDHIYAGVRAGASALPDAALRPRYFWVQGALAKHVKRNSIDNVDRLRALGLDARLIPVNTDGETRRNIEMIEAHVRASDRPVVLIGHSRGGVMIHDWYRAASRELRDKVARLVLIQSPLTGTPLANRMLSLPAAQLILRAISRLILDSDITPTLRELSVEGRRAALSALPPLEPEDLDKIYTIRSFMDRRRRLVAPSDGVVPLDSASLPGAYDVLIYGLDHGNMVISHPGWFKRLIGYTLNRYYQPAELTESIVRLIFRR
ncbi:MAG: alpha/beta fold hydrolase [Elusimicrobia bacterium]|nr:alpha/beta fold hydrolase [Elusimicrobiota bacterium]